MTQNNSFKKCWMQISKVIWSSPFLLVEMLSRLDKGITKLSTELLLTLMQDLLHNSQRPKLNWLQNHILSTMKYGWTQKKEFRKLATRNQGITRGAILTLWIKFFAAKIKISIKTSPKEEKLVVLREDWTFLLHVKNVR